MVEAAAEVDRNGEATGATLTRQVQPRLLHQRILLPPLPYPQVNLGDRAYPRKRPTRQQDQLLRRRLSP